MEFYDVKSKKKVIVPKEQVDYLKLKNGRFMAMTNYKGMKLRKFVSKDQVKGKPTWEKID